MNVKIKEARKYRDKTQKEITNFFNFNSEATVSGWELGRSSPSAASLGALAEYLNLDIRYFFGQLSLEEADLLTRESKEKEKEARQMLSKQAARIAERISASAPLYAIFARIEFLNPEHLKQIETAIIATMAAYQMDQDKKEKMA